MRRITTPFIRKLGEELIEVLFTNIADNIEMTDNENLGKSVQEFLIGMKTKLTEIESNLYNLSKDVVELEKKEVKCVNNLESEETNQPLSAAQGKILNEKISQVKASAYYTNLEYNTKEFWDFIDSLPDGALVSIPENKILLGSSINDISGLSLYDYNYTPITTIRDVSLYKNTSSPISTVDS